MSSAARPRSTVLPAGVRRLDRRAGDRLYRSPSPGVVDGALHWVSASAESGLFWMSIVGAVAGTGPRGRRAAIRGALTLGAATASANLVAKQLIRVCRPVARGVRHGVRNVRNPKSPSFPSGHGATAAALAAGVGAESRGRGSVLALLALLVSYSRLHVGAHELSDVLTGNLYGAAVGLLGFVLFRPRRG